MIEAIEEVTLASEHAQIPTVTHTAAASNDAVALSETARATVLNQEGLSIAQIADELGITTSVVLTDLGIAEANLAGVTSGAAAQEGSVGSY